MVKRVKSQYNQVLSVNIVILRAEVMQSGVGCYGVPAATVMQLLSCKIQKVRKTMYPFEIITYVNWYISSVV